MKKSFMNKHLVSNLKMKQ